MLIATLPALLAAQTPVVSVTTVDGIAVINTTNYAQVQFTRTGPTGAPLHVRHHFTGNATTWDDFRLLDDTMPDTVTIPAGQSSVTLTYKATGVNNVAEPEFARFALMDLADYDLGTANVASFNIYTTEPATPVVTIATLDDITVINSTDYAQVQFTRTGSTSAPLNVQYHFTGNATTWDDFRLLDDTMPDTVTIPAGQSSVTLTFKATGVNNVAEPEFARFQLMDLADYDPGTASIASFNIHTTLPGTPVVSIATLDDVAVINSTNYAQVQFTRTGPTHAPLQVRHHFTGTATTWDDFRLLDDTMPDTVTIPAGQSSVTMTYKATGVNNVSEPEYARFELMDLADYDLGAATIASFNVYTTLPSGTPTVTIAASPSNAVIDGTHAILTFTRTGATSAALNVSFTTAGNAVRDVDYQTPTGAVPTSITIPAGATSATLGIKALANPGRTAVFSLSSSSSYTLGTPNSATVTLQVGGSPSVAFNPTNYVDLALPIPGDRILNILSDGRPSLPSVLELRRINTKQAGSPPDSWNFVDASNNLTLSPSDFTVKVNGTPVGVTAVSFKRRPLFARTAFHDLRIENNIYLHLAGPIPENQSVEVTSAKLAGETFAAVADPLRYNPALHVNQEGYVPNFAKVAMVGYYLGNLNGSLNELNIPVGTPFKIVEAQSGVEKFSGTLVASPDVGWQNSGGALPYQRVLKADFSSIANPAPGTKYQLVVPGMGASLPFAIHDGVAMGYLRTLMLGLYHQRCGHPVGMPHTRFEHAACHTAPAEVPLSTTTHPIAWSIIADTTQQAITGPQSLRYAYNNQGPIDVSGGHHDAGDYSKYTINSALLINNLVFAADAIDHAAALDNLGIPESGNGKPDILDEAKIEADFLAKMQDADGGFYVLVYPKESRYENGRPDYPAGGAITQIVWPKNTAVTAAAVAALAQCASSPAFKQHFAADAERYRLKALAGWNFLQQAIATHGGNRYQPIYHYGGSYDDVDELAWAACELFLLTGDQQYHQQLKTWFPDPALRMGTYNHNWDPLFEGYGNAVRSYAFAVESARLSASQIDPVYLQKCRNRILQPPQDDPSLGHALQWWTQSAYGASIPYPAKQYGGLVGYYHSLNRAADIAAANALEPTPDKLAALVGNLNYEGGTNPVNAVYITGLGRKRQRELVSQWFVADHQALPGAGLTVAQVVAQYGRHQLYGDWGSAELKALAFPTDEIENTNLAVQYPTYDRWADVWNIAAEGVTSRQAGALISVGALAVETAARLQPWTSGTATIVAPGMPATPLVNQPITFTVSSPHIDVGAATVVWEGSGNEPRFGPSYVYVPLTAGPHWVEVEVAAIDGRRVFARKTFTVQ